MKPLTVMSVFGTRPEAIKMAPVVRRLRGCPQVRSVVCVSSQHREMLDQVLEIFGIRPDHDLEVMVPNQKLAGLSSTILDRLDVVIEQERPDVILVQGDTTTAFISALAGFYHRVAVGHVEAGLRTHDKYAPFPEEMNRRLATQLTSIHFAPTARNREALLREGVDAEDVVVTGNPVIDALKWIVAKNHFATSSGDDRVRLLVTAHRRETWGEPLEQICLALLDILSAKPEVEVLLPVHLNPNVRGTIEQMLGHHDRVTLSKPLDYVALIRELARCHFVLTDSGGIQEEAPALGKPVLVLRNETERQEAVDAGTAMLVGPDRNRIVSESLRLIDSKDAYEAMAKAANPYGDGHASQKIVDAVLNRFSGNHVATA